METVGNHSNTRVFRDRVEYIISPDMMDPLDVVSSYNVSQGNETQTKSSVSQNGTLHPDIETGYAEILEMAFIVNKYYLWVVFAFGFPGNLATIVTIARMQNLGSFAFYVVSLAVMDNLALMVKILIYQLIDNKYMVSASCQVLSFLGTFLVTFANWILVMMAVERLIAVRYPFRIKHCIGFKKSAAALAITGGVIGCAYAPIIWISYYDERSGNCAVIDMTRQLKLSLHWINIALFAFIPFSVLMFCNVFIAKEIRSSFRIRRAMRSISSMSLNSRCCDLSLQRQIMVMLFTTTLMFIVFLFPICAFAVADFYWKVQMFTRSFAVKYLLNQLVYVLCDSTHAINFYLYFLSARRFRSSFVRMSSCLSMRSASL